MLSSTLSTEKAAKRIGGSIKHAPQPPQGRCLVWLRNPVAHGTGTVGIVGRLALGRAAKCVWPYFLLGKVPKRIGVAAKFSLHGGGRSTIRPCHGSADAVPALCFIGTAYRFIRHWRRGTLFPPWHSMLCIGIGSHQLISPPPEQGYVQSASNLSSA